MSTTYVALDNPFIYEIWTNTHETWTLVPEHPSRLTCTFFALENFLFWFAQHRRLNVRRLWNNHQTNTLKYAKNNLLIALYLTETIYSIMQTEQNKLISDSVLFYTKQANNNKNKIHRNLHTHTPATLETIEASSCALKTWTEWENKINMKEAEIYINIVLEYDDWCFNWVVIRLKLNK